MSEVDIAVELLAQSVDAIVVSRKNGESVPIQSIEEAMNLLIDIYSDWGSKHDA